MDGLYSLKGKNIILGVTASIAAYKACDICSCLMKKGANVQVIMTRDAQEFIRPLTLQTLSGRPVITGLFDEVKEWKVDHVGAAEWADCILAAPATADIMAKFACGLADDSLTCTWLASKAPKVVAPAMNTGMYEAEATQKNMEILRSRGVVFAEPEVGMLACGAVGKGHIADTDTILDYVSYALAPKPLKGKTLLVSAGPTAEDIDPVRYLTNRSTGLMGYSIAYEGWLLGAEVTLVSGPVSLKAPTGVNLISVRSAEDMYEAVMKEKEKDCIIMAAAVADYTPKEKAPDKIKKKEGPFVIETKRTRDILKALGQGKRAGQKLIGFAAETKDLEENARAKLQSKNLDFICLNDVMKTDAGFGSKTNILTLLYQDGRIEKMDKMSKEDCGAVILQRAFEF